jgi:hypothetical protein
MRKSSVGLRVPVTVVAVGRLMTPPLLNDD